MIKVLFIPRVWVLIAIVFTAYSVYGLIGYINTFAIKYYGLSAASGATLGGVRYLVQGIGGIIGGFLADKMHSRIKVIAIGAVLLAISFAVYIVLPSNAIYLNAVIINLC